MQVQSSATGRQSGQILAVFALALVAIVAMVGLVLDGGFTFVQRRDQQNVADAAALAAAYAYGNSSTASTAAAAAAAQSMAAANGYANGTDGVVVDVTWDAPGGAGRHFTVSVTKPHRNYFAGIVGMNAWTVSTTATSLAGRPNAAIGAMPIIFNQRAFAENGAGPSHPFTYLQAGDTGPNPIPQDGITFNWTMYCDSCNANTSTVAALIDGGGQQTVVSLDDKLDPLNSGAHTSDFTSLAAQIGKEFPIPIVDDAGRMVGWAMFHLTNSDGASTKSISGWFVSPVNPSSMRIVDGVSTGGDAGTYIAKLVN
jgi:Flp pilus assembly protein TadG